MAPQQNKNGPKDAFKNLSKQTRLQSNDLNQCLPKKGDMQ